MMEKEDVEQNVATVKVGRFLMGNALIVELNIISYICRNRREI